MAAASFLLKIRRFYSFCTVVVCICIFQAEIVECRTVSSEIGEDRIILSAATQRADFIVPTEAIIPHVPKHSYSSTDLIPTYYKVQVILDSGIEPVNSDIIQTLIGSLAKQLDLPKKNVRVSEIKPIEGLVELYFVYIMANDIRGGVDMAGVSQDSNEEIAVLVPGSKVVELISPEQLEDDMAPVRVLRVRADSPEQPNIRIQSTSSEQAKVWTIFRNHIWSSWQLPLIISSSLLAVFTVSLLVVFVCYRREISKKKPPPEEMSPPDDVKRIVYQPVVKPAVKRCDNVQPECRDIYLTENEAEMLSPVRSPLRIKAKGLLERRGSNASLTLDLNKSEENLNSKDCSGVEILLSAGNRLSRKQLRNCMKDVKALHTEFWEIPMNHPIRVEIAGSGTKNRYKTILPNENSRVSLYESNSDPLSTYINANYIRGYENEPKAYIATQGPMAHTVQDFWKMVWNERCPIIVMITKLKEKNKVKCEPYVPVNSHWYDDIQVTVTKMVHRDGYTIRELFIQNDEEVHQVIHFWYTAWPDHKTPTTAKQLLAMSMEVEALRHDNNGAVKGPTIIHCSAGIGRTGCFIAISMGIQQLLEENVVDILGIVCSLRLDRGGMVQSAEQYEFVHQALLLFERSLPQICGE